MDEKNKAEEVVEAVEASKQNVSYKIKKLAEAAKGKWVSVAVVVLLAGLVAGSYYYSFNKSVLKPEVAKAKVVEFVKNNLVQSGTEVAVKEIIKENGLYKVVIKVGGDKGQEVPVYLTTDGKKFFPQGMDVAEVEAKNKDGKQAEEEQNKPVTKSDVPEVNLFVMSYCPYGTQMEKGILPAVQTLGGKIKFNLKFVDYIMHGKKESDENLRQYCIQKNEPAKLDDYLNCFLKKGEGTEAACLKTANINIAKSSSCMSETDAQFKITEKFNDKNAWDNAQFPPFDVNKDENNAFGVQGSPTLVINGTKVNAQRDPASLLASICSAFNNPPKECEKKLSSTAPAPGFGDGASANGANASCATN